MTEANTYTMTDLPTIISPELRERMLADNYRWVERKLGCPVFYRILSAYYPDDGMMAVETLWAGDIYGRPRGGQLAPLSIIAQTLVYPINLTPLPGDRVYTEARPHTYGVIEGLFDPEEPSTDPLTTWYASAYRDTKSVSCSGGPALYVPLSELEETPEIHFQQFWAFHRHFATAHNGYNYTLPVRTWNWKRP